MFGAQGNNLVKTMLRLCRGQSTGCPTSASSTASALWTLAMEYHDLGSLHSETYHFSGAPAIIWHEFALEIFHRGLQYGLVTKIPQGTGPRLDRISHSSEASPLVVNGLLETAGDARCKKVRSAAGPYERSGRTGLLGNNCFEQDYALAELGWASRFR